MRQAMRQAMRQWRHIRFEDMTGILSLFEYLGANRQRDETLLHSVTHISFSCRAFTSLAHHLCEPNSSNHSTAQQCIARFTNLLQPQDLCGTYLERTPKSSVAAEGLFAEQEEVPKQLYEGWTSSLRKVTIHGVHQDSRVNDQVLRWEIFYLDNRQSWHHPISGQTWELLLPRRERQGTDLFAVEFFNVWVSIIISDPFDSLYRNTVKVKKREDSGYSTWICQRGDHVLGRQPRTKVRGLRRSVSDERRTPLLFPEVINT